jgi:1,4-alpha-glucan branching enzyme
MVSRPTYAGGLGFGYKWDMGWMHDTLEYMSLDPIFRKYHYNKLTFRMEYAFRENFILPLSHDEVVHGKGSILGIMPGDDWQKFASFRLLLAYMYAQPGKKLLFMGAEFGQWGEWNHDMSLDWNLLQYERHAELQRWVEALNQLYRSEPALHELDCAPSGFESIDCNAEESLISFMRKGRSTSSIVHVVYNFTSVPRWNHRIAVPCGGIWRQVLSSDDERFGGSRQGTSEQIEAQPIPFYNLPYSLNIYLPPLTAIFLKN